MKKMIAGAVIIASLAAGFTACTDTEKEEAIKEITTARQEFLKLDSVLKQTNNYLVGRKDSLTGLAEKDPATKLRVDSILKAGEKELAEFDSVTVAHGNMAVELEAALNDIESGTLKWQEVLEKLPEMKQKHESAAKLSEETSKALLLLIVSEGTTATAVNESSGKTK